MKNCLLIVIFAAAVFLESAQTASACSCSLPNMDESVKTQVKSAKKEATGVFVGKVVSIRYSDEKFGDTPSAMYAKIEVARSWKGPETEFIEVGTANICCICGFTFEVGKTYIVYSYSSSYASDPKLLNVTSCSRTSVITSKSADEKYLGKTRKPKKS